MNDEIKPGSRPDADEVALAALLSKTGPREQADMALQERVRAAVAVEWRKTQASRMPPHASVRPSGRVLQGRWLAVAAAAGVGALTLAWLLPGAATGPVAVATLQRVAGAVSVDGTAPAPGTVLHAGERIATGPAGHAVLRTGTGVELRLDAGTRLAWKAADRAVLEAGAAYVDSRIHEIGPSDLQIDTVAGAVRHLGTRYQVRVQAGTVEVAVREGRVSVGSGAQAPVVGAGERLTVSSGVATREALSNTAEAWDWAERLAEGFAIEGRRLPEFLDWAGRETGREIVYASPASRAAAERIALRGSVADLAPEDALAAVLPTTGVGWRIDESRVYIKAN